MSLNNLTQKARYVSLVTAVMWGILGFVSSLSVLFILYSMYLVTATGYIVVAGFYWFDDTKLIEPFPLCHTVALPVVYGFAFAAVSVLHNVVVSGVTSHNLLLLSAVSNFGFTTGFAAVAVFSTLADTSNSIGENTSNSESAG